MPLRSLVAVSVLAAGLTLGGCASEAAARGVVAVRVGPPPLRHEVVPRRPGPGWVWVGGYWSARADRYVWVAGRWTRPPRTGAVWVAPRYERRRGSWVVVGGYWR